MSCRYAGAGHKAMTSPLLHRGRNSPFQKPRRNFSEEPETWHFYVLYIPAPSPHINLFLTKTNTENPTMISVSHPECTWNVTCDVGRELEHARAASSSAVLVYASPHSA